MRSLLPLVACPLLWAQTAPPPYVREGKTVKISEHIWVIPDGRVDLVPNIGFIIGNKATLVVDSGMGDRNGQATLRELQKLNKNADLYLTTTHFHPEHVSGFHVFPPRAKLIRPAIQQEELNTKGPGMILQFSGMSPAHAELLKGAVLRPADIVFDGSVEVDLGGVTARLLTLGPAHTKGDNFIWVKEDRVLFGGDVITNRFFPIINSSGANWLSILDKLAALEPRIVVPGHGETGDAGLLAQESAFFKEMLTRTAELKKQGKPADDAAKLLTEELKAKYSTWDNPGFLPAGLKRIYAEVE